MAINEENKIEEKTKSISFVEQLEIGRAHV